MRQREFVHFETRQDRPRYMVERFAPYFEGRVLDVGCDRAVLRDFVGAERYTGIDLSEEADIRQNLQQDGRLPFDDASQDTVVCTDVLEHLDNLHEVYGEIARVTRRFAIISLPNNWNAARVRLRRGYGSFAHYGLPVDPPVDRHRWFFGLDEATAFLEQGAARHGLAVREMVVLEKPRPTWSRALRRLRYPSLRRYLNLYSHTVVCVHERA